MSDFLRKFDRDGRGGSSAESDCLDGHRAHGDRGLGCGAYAAGALCAGRIGRLERAVGGAWSPRRRPHIPQGSGSDNYLEVIASGYHPCWVADPLKTVLGAQVRALRRSRGLTQEKLAENLGVSPRYLAGIERGERNLTMDSVDELAGQLRVASLELLDPTATPQ